MPGLELIGPIAGSPRVDAPDELTQGAEGIGLFIVGDARAVPAYSGSEVGARWLCRLQGPIVKQIPDWPTGKDTFGYHPNEQAARAMYAALRQHLLLRVAGIQPQDTRASFPLNAPNASSESFWSQGNEVARMMLDNMADLQVVVRNTDHLWAFDAVVGQPGPKLVSYSTQSDVLYLAIAKGPSGAAEHLAIIYSPKHEPQPIISEGMPRAEEDTGFKTEKVTFPSNIAVAFWGRAGGQQILAPARGGDAGAMLHQYLGANVTAPLQTNVPGLDARLQGTPAAYAVRMEPGEYEGRFFMLDPRPGEGYSFLVVSRVGAPSFQPLVLGNAGGKVLGGLTLDQYAQLAAERDRILMQQGSNAGPALVQLCHRYGAGAGRIPMTAGRIPEWDRLINGGDPALSAQWATQYGMAQARLSGVLLTPEQLAQMAQQQQATQQHLQQAAQQNKDARKELQDGACRLIEMARTHSAEQLVQAAAAIVPTTMRQDGTPAYAFYKALTILRAPGEGENPKFQAVDQVVEKIARAHWLSMKEEDRKSEGSEKSYVKDKIADIYEKNGLPVPGVGGFLGRFMDKL